MRAWPLVRLGFALLAELALCAALNLFDDWTLAEMPVRFVVVAMAAGVAYLVAAASFPESVDRRKQALLFWSVAIVLRVAVLPLEPGDDFWRYQWEGKIQRAGFNPYLHAPDDPVLAPIRAEFPGWEKINHRDFRAIYPPAAELVFRALDAVSDNPLLYKLLFAAADLATAAVLLSLVRYRDAVWYAWNPLVVYSFAGSAHFDSLMLLPMLGGIVCLTRAKTSWRWACAAAVLFGLAISIKLIPLLLLPLAAFALRSRAVTLLVSLAIPLALSTAYGFPQLPIWDSLRQFANVTRLNDLFWWMIEDTVWPNPRQKNYQYNRIILVAVVAVSLLFWRNWRRGMLWVMGTALVLSPVLHPWYCTWILPLAAWRRAFPWHVLSISLFAYFLFWNERLFPLPWHAEWWLRTIIIVPALVATLFYFARGRENAAVASS